VMTMTVKRPSRCLWRSTPLLAISWSVIVAACAMVGEDAVPTEPVTTRSSSAMPSHQGATRVVPEPTTYERTFAQLQKLAGAVLEEYPTDRFHVSPPRDQLVSPKTVAHIGAQDSSFEEEVIIEPLLQARLTA